MKHPNGKLSAMRRRLFSSVNNGMWYLKEFRPYCGSVTATMVMSQLDQHFATTGDGFYKFLEPCPGHHIYKDGDSWVEELGFSKDEFRIAFDKIGKRYTSKKEYDESVDKFDGKYYCSYHDKISGLTHYFRDHEKVDAIIDRVIDGLQYEPVDRQTQSTVNRQTQSTEIDKLDLRKSINSISNNSSTKTTTKSTTEREVSATEKPDYTQLQSRADSLSPTDLGKFLMCRMNMLHLKHRRRSYCKADGSKWEREVLIDSYKNYADCTVRLFDCFWEQMFIRWDSLACLKWAREKSEPVATTPNLSYISKNMAVFFDEVMGKHFAKKAEGNGNGKPSDTLAALERVKQSGNGLSFVRPPPTPPVETPDYPVAAAV